MAAPTNAQLAAQVTAALQKINAREAQYRDWLAGTATGGPNGDGRYPITNTAGETFLLESLTCVVDTVAGPAAMSSKAQLLAEAARDTSVTAQLQSQDNAALASSARADAQDARTLARQYRDDAAAYAANLQVTRDATDSMRESAQLARDEAVAARDVTVDAKGVTLVARAEAVTARDQAQAFAAAINPAALATKSDLASEIAKLVGQAPATLNALDEIARALGNDPNFATTMTAQLAGKAALVHTHGIADITGLQTALDQKQPVGSYLSTTGGSLTGDLTLGGGKWLWMSYQGTGHAISINPGPGDVIDFFDRSAGAFAPIRAGKIFANGRDVLAELDAKQAAGNYLSTNGGTVANTLQTSQLRASGQIRATGWYGDAGGTADGLGVEIGSTGGNSYVYSYNRSASAYGPLILSGSVVSFQTSNVNIAGYGIWHAGNFNPATKPDVGTNVTFRDVVADRGNNTGVIYFGSPSQSKYLYYDGSMYYLPGAPLSVGGAMTASGAVVAGSDGFKQATYTVNARNPIWRFGNADTYGISYYQGSAGVGGADSIGFHFGDVSAGGCYVTINTYDGGRVRAKANVELMSNRNQLISQYDPTTTQGIWAMGDAYKLPVGNSNNYGSHYGLCWSFEPNYGGTGNNPQSKPGLSHQLLIQHAGVTRTAIGIGIWTSGSIVQGGNAVQPLKPHKLYRRDDTGSDYSVQHHWTGTHWWLRGYANDTDFHAECRVGYADNAGAVGGAGASAPAAGNTLALRSAEGYLQATYLNQTSPNYENGTVNQIMVTNGSDNYLRKCGPEAFVSQMNNVPGNRKIVSSTQPSGMVAGDIWLKPL